MDVLLTILFFLFIALVASQCNAGAASGYRTAHDEHAGPPHVDELARRDDDWLQQKLDPFDDWKPADPVSMHLDTGWTTGTQGYGYYSGGIRIDD